jgi:hypothetical protein
MNGRGDGCGCFTAMVWLFVIALICSVIVETMMR